MSDERICPTCGTETRKTGANTLNLVHFKSRNQAGQ